jgi:type II secretory pathway pseudopilin PulG
MRMRTRPAFTLFQLLVLLAMLGFLFALLFPAILRVRLAAARAQSINNLKQIAIACHNYNDANQTFPPGNDDNNFSAAAKLLPYIEQDNVYKLIDFSKPCTDKANETVRGIIIKTFLNPRDTQPIAAATNYLFNAGSKPDLKDNDGIFFQNSKVRFADITDGTSNTLLAGETLRGGGIVPARDVHRQHVQLDKDALANLNDESGVKEWKEDKHIVGDRCSAWIDGRFLQGTFTGTRMPNDPKPDVSCGGMGGLSGLRSMDDAITIAICDGSVRTTRKTSLELWKLLTSRNDGQVLPDF